MRETRIKSGFEHEADSLARRFSYYDLKVSANTVTEDVIKFCKITAICQFCNCKNRKHLTLNRTCVPVVNNVFTETTLCYGVIEIKQFLCRFYAFSNLLILHIWLITNDSEDVSQWYLRAKSELRNATTRSNTKHDNLMYWQDNERL